ncbi:MAG: trypsin-like peptidase domain-containing protein [Chloroflexi bacterium]|nr:trypsin-like peptidase domain-containing protein [Chloroflexota bacterium]
MKKLRPLLVVLVLTAVTLSCQGSPLFFSEKTAENNPASTVTSLIATPLSASTLDLPPVSSDLLDMEQLQVSLYQQVSPGVVSIQTLDDQGGVQGSGFVYDLEGHIITNYHVVQDAQQIEIDFPSGLKVYGTVIGIDIDSDIAVIKVDVPAEQLYPVLLGDSDQVQIGQTVIAIGNPYGLTGTMTAGIVSAKGRTLSSLRVTEEGQSFSAGDLIQTDASINPGNSGGPLLNLAGEVVGINRAIRLSGVTDEGDPINTGIGFAISVNILKRVVPDLISKGSYDYPYVGISARPELTLIEAEALGLSQTTGAYIVEVVPGGPADAAGLRAGTRQTEYVGLNAGGDLITAIDGQSVMTFSDFLGYLMTQKSPGDTVAITFIRNNENREVELTLETRP